MTLVTAALLVFAAPWWSAVLPLAWLVVFSATRVSPAKAEPRWLPEDRAVVQMWQVEQYDRCPDCGTFSWEYEEDPEAWTADLHWCLGCKSIEELRDQTTRERENLPSEGFKIRLYRHLPEGVTDGE